VSGLLKTLSGAIGAEADELAALPALSPDATEAPAA
jgi:hypothetical protein